MGRQSKNSVRENFARLRGASIVVGILSCAVNLLMLSGPIFMLQIYDRVLTSQSVPTLVALFFFVCAMFVMLGLFNFLRARILSRVSQNLEQKLAPLVFRSWLGQAVDGASASYNPNNDLSVMRRFISSPTALALYDLPWFPIYLLVVFALHQQLGLLATAGAVIVICLALLNEWMTARSANAGAEAEFVEGQFADQARRAADSVIAMGMLSNATSAWQILRRHALAENQTAVERSEYFSAGSKAFRLLLQSAILGLGAYLAINQEITAGMIVAASIIAGRALAPMDQVIGGWGAIKRSRMARRRLADYLDQQLEPDAKPIQLPTPKGHVRLENVSKRVPGNPSANAGKFILQNVSFELQPGEGLGVIGPSACGKSSLAKLLVGLWMPDLGAVRLDGATFDQWDPEQIGPHIGYLPQQVALLAGTIGENISRFDDTANSEQIVAAAQAAGVHEMILGFPNGYSTNVHDGTSPLTGGQRQRIGLARAIFRNPALVVLDEPNSNLDAEGDQGLTQAIARLRAQGSVVVVMAHRPSAIAAVDKVLMLREGRVVDFGPKTEVLRKVTRAA